MPDRFPVPDPTRVSLDTARTVEPPPFERVVDRARANRRRRLATGTVSALVVAAFAAGALANGVHPHRAEGPAGPAPSRHLRSPHPAASLAERIVTDPKAGVLEFAASPGDPDVRAVVKGGALGLSNADTQWALAVTDDGFRTSHFLHIGEPGDEVIPLNGDWFYVGSGPAGGGPGGWVVSATGIPTRVRFSHATRPVASGDALVSCGDWQYCTLDQGTEVAHWFPGPAPQQPRRPGLANGLFTLWQSGALLWGYDGNTDEPGQHLALHLSEDGGATWTTHPVPDGKADATRMASAAPEDLAIIYSTGHGPRATPQEAIHFRTLLRSRDGGRHWQTIRVPHFGDLTDGAVLPDGRALLVTVSGRLLRSTDASWHAWQPVPGWPPARGYDEQHLSVFSDGTLFSVREPAGRGTGAVWISTDAGSTWTRSAQPTAADSPR